MEVGIRRPTMEECAVIEIFGTANDAKALEALADAAEGAGLSLDWHERMDWTEIIEAMIDASNDGEWLRLVKDECGTFSEVLKACRNAGLSYIHTRGISGDEGYHTASFWTPGWDKEFHCGLVNGITLGVPFADIQRASEEGYGAVQDLVAAYERNTLAHVEKSLKLAPEAVAELRGIAMTA
jgi:hypothetical protein